VHLDIAGGFDHPGPSVFPFFLPQSLGLKAEAAEEKGWDEQAEGGSDSGP